mmetsp:Transcript_10835/g.17522  ORF Transcript_10835/g.17522 Transcript_10835/m.17522 type:complete len:229 (-) Transcript_10835:372-1058(-)
MPLFAFELGDHKVKRLTILFFDRLCNFIHFLWSGASEVDNLHIPIVLVLSLHVFVLQVEARLWSDAGHGQLPNGGVHFCFLQCPVPNIEVLWVVDVPEGHLPAVMNVASLAAHPGHHLGHVSPERVSLLPSPWIQFHSDALSVPWLPAVVWHLFVFAVRVVVLPVCLAFACLRFLSFHSHTSPRRKGLVNAMCNFVRRGLVDTAKVGEGPVKPFDLPVRFRDETRFWC